MTITITALPATLGNDAETIIDDEGDAPLRCCLRASRPGERIALVSVTPSGPAGAYAESGPVFLHAGDCPGPAEPGYPADFQARPQILRAYDRNGRIAGGRLVTADEDHVAAAEQLLQDPAIAFLHTRNVVYGCYMLTIERG